MQIVEGQIVFSPTDLNQYVECPHLTRLNVEVLSGKTLPRSSSETADLYARRGIEHETAYLERLRAAGREVVTIAQSREPSDLALRAGETFAAMERGADVIYQGVFFDGRWRGTADFLVRLDEPSARWRHSYEAVNTKLAKSARPYYIVQLCAYSEMIERAQGSAPREMRIVLGGFRERAYSVALYAPYFRALRARFEHEVAALRG